MKATQALHDLGQSIWLDNITRCSMATRRFLRDRQDVLLVAGANLPMLLDFVFAESLPPMEAARHALDRGRAAITASGGGAGGKGA